MTIGERIKYIRESQRMTQVELANACNISKQTLYKYENNIVTNIPSDKIELIAEKLNTSPSNLMGWEEQDSKKITVTEMVQSVTNALISKNDVDDFISAIFSVFDEQQCKLLENYDKLTDEGRKKLLDYSTDLLEIGKYNNSADS